jgi:sulfur carrier protein
MEIDHFMKIYLNGNPHELEKSISVADLLGSIGFGGKPVVVELNEEAVFPRDYSNVMVENEARVEVVTLAAGG